MSVLKAYFSNTIDQCSPSRDDFQRVVNFDEDGNEFITYEPIDYPTLVESRGLVSDWSLDTLLKAGIDPAFPIHTGYNTRLQGVNDIQQVSVDVEKLFEQIENEKNNK